MKSLLESIYDEQMILEDIILGEKMEGKKAFANFFDWNNPNFSKADSLTLIIEEQLFYNNQVMTKGYFTPFNWGDSTFEAMQFTTILTFNDQDKIIKHVDWINYPNNLIDYNKRKNANDWIVK